MEPAESPAKSRIASIVFAILGVADGLSLGWFLLLFTTTGDYLVMSPLSALVTLSLMVGLGVFGYRVSTLGARVGLAVGALLAIAFWISVPFGWWAHGPPMPSEVSAASP